MTWIGPNWGMWAETVDEMNDISKRSEKNYQSAVEWRDYAKKLEKRREETWQAFRESSGNASGQVALRDARTAELRNYDPTNRMLSKEVRLEIFNKGKNERLEEIDRG
jgi:hypothetical protein